MLVSPTPGPATTLKSDSTLERGLGGPYCSVHGGGQAEAEVTAGLQFQKGNLGAGHFLSVGCQKQKVIRGDSADGQAPDVQG